MTVTPKEIAAARALRDEARAIASSHFKEARTDLSPETIGKRIRHKASNEAMHVLDETRTVAADNKLVIGATLATLAGWFARRPLAKLFSRIAPTRRRSNKLRKKMERLLPWLVR